MPATPGNKADRRLHGQGLSLRSVWPIATSRATRRPCWFVSEEKNGGFAPGRRARPRGRSLLRTIPSGEAVRAMHKGCKGETAVGLSRSPERCPLKAPPRHLLRRNLLVARRRDSP